MLDDVFIIWYCDGTGDERQNKMFMVKKGEVDLAEGIYEVNQGVRYWADLDQGFNNLLNEYGNQLVTIQRRNDGDDVWAYYYIFMVINIGGDKPMVIVIIMVKCGEFFDDDTQRLGKWRIYWYANSIILL